jgi:hypothetical protein
LSAVLEMEPALHKVWTAEPVFSPDGRRIVCGFLGDGKIGVWDSRSGRLLAAVAEETAPWVIGFSPDGTRFLSRSRSRTDDVVRVWDAQSLRALLTLHNDEGEGERWAGFTPDGSRILFVSPDGTVRQWDTRSSHRLEALMYITALEEKTPRKPLTPQAAVRYIRNDAELDAPVRQAALEQLEAFGDFNEGWGAKALKTLLSPRAGMAAYREVLANARRAAAVEPSNGDTLNALGAARYRVGEIPGGRCHAGALPGSPQVRFTGEHRVPGDGSLPVGAHHRGHSPGGAPARNVSRHCRIARSVARSGVRDRRALSL